MEAESNFTLVWLTYLLAGGCFYWVYWKATRLPKALWLSYSLRALMLALMLTPWDANVEGTNLAPALMVVMMDAITLGTDTAGRALVPLILSLLLAEIVATVAYLIMRNRKKPVNTNS